MYLLIYIYMFCYKSARRALARKAGRATGILFPFCLFGARDRSNCPDIWSVWSDKVPTPTNPFRREPVAHPV